MNKISKKSVFGIATVGAAAALVAGFAAPAMASVGHDSSLAVPSTHSSSSTSSESTVTQAQLDALRNVTTGIGTGTASNWSPVVVSPSLNAPVSTGDIGSGNAIASGDQVPVLSGNTVQIPVLSGNQTAVGNNDAVGNLTGSINTSVSDLVNSVTKDVGNPTSSTTNSSTSSSTSSVSGIIDSALGNR
jgi:hypothetical protein